MLDPFDETVAPPAPRTGARRPAPAPLPRSAFGMPLGRMAALVLLAAALLWAVWVSKGLYELAHKRDHLVKVRLSEIVTEYVQATARSSLPPEQIGQQTALFLRAVNDSVEKHRSAGQVVLLANAVVAGDVPDITNEVRTQVYSKVGPPPAPAPAENVQGAMQQYMAATSAAVSNGQ